MSHVEWWMRVDRKAELAMAREALEKGGLWVLLASDGQGGSELARQIAELAESAGRACVLGRDTQTIDTLKGALLHTWSQMIQAESTALPMSALISGEEIGLVADRLRGELDACTQRPIVVLERVDQGRALDGEGLAALDRLAGGEQTVIVVTARSYGTAWKNCETLRKVRALARFRAEHVMEAVRAGPVWPTDAPAQQALEQQLRTTLGSGNIQPDDVFNALAAL